MAGYSVEDQVTALEALAVGRKPRRIVWVNLVLWIALLLLDAINLGILLLAFWSAWQTGEWRSLDRNWLGSALLIPLTFFLLVILKVQRRDASPAANALLQASREYGDNTPLASPQPELLDDAEQPSGSQRFGNLGAFSNSKQFFDALNRYSASVPIFLTLQSLPELYSGIEHETLPALAPYLPDDLAITIGFAAVVVAYALAIIGVWLRWGRHLHGVPVTADEWGIEWRSARGRTLSLAWHSVQSFFVFSYEISVARTGSTLKSEVHVLDGGETLLVLCYS
jgi:hypothetical protein